MLKNVECDENVDLRRHEIRRYYERAFLLMVWVDAANTSHIVADPRLARLSL